MNLAKEMKEAASAREIIVEGKIHITETEEIIEEEIPLPVKEMFLTKVVDVDGKDFMKFILTSFSIVFTQFHPLIVPNPLR